MVEKIVVQKNNFSGAPDERNVAYWAYNDKLYVFRTASTFQSSLRGFENMVVWELDPFALRP